MAEVRSILVIRLSSIGDIILTTPVVRSLRTRWPEARIDYCTGPAFAPLLVANPHLDGLYHRDDLPASSYDLVVDLQNNARSGALVKRVSGGRVVRYRKENWKKWLLVHLKMNFYGSMAPSVVERYLGSLASDGVRLDHAGCELFPSDADREFARSSLFSDGSPHLAVCFGAKHFTKRWPARKFAETISAVLAETDARVLLLGGAEDAVHASEIMRILPADAAVRVRNLAGACSLMQTAALLERSGAVLTNDTGLMHMASAFGRKLFVLFGSSSPLLGFLPYRVPCLLFEVHGLSCRPCSHIGRDRCPKGHFRCMEEISAPGVADAIAGWFGRRLA